MSKNRFQIGYPYAVPDEKTKDTIVILFPNKYQGFSCVYSDDRKQRYSLLSEDPVPRILDGIKHGVFGILKQSNDERKSIVKNGQMLMSRQKRILHYCYLVPA